MIKQLILLIIMISFSYAKTYEGTYKISYGIFGELGIATTKLTINNDNYEIIINAKATGMAKFLSNGKEETYKSFGKIINNEFISHKYITDKKTNSKQRVKKYDFDYEKQVINIDSTKKYHEVVLGDNFEQTSKEVIENSTSQNSFFANTDILSLFFNVTKNLKNLDRSINYEYKTVGAKEENGKINVYFPNINQKKDFDELFENKNEKMIVSINQPIFSSQKGELYISVNKNGFCNKAILKDVIMFGDITGELVKFKVRD